MDWILKQCDVNKDIKITDKMQTSLPDIQLSEADRVFRHYVKLSQSSAERRIEEAIQPNISLADITSRILNPYQEITQKIDKLTEILTTAHCRFGWHPILFLSL